MAKPSNSNGQALAQECFWPKYLIDLFILIYLFIYIFKSFGRYDFIPTN